MAPQAQEATRVLACLFLIILLPPSSSLLTSFSEEEIEAKGNEMMNDLRNNNWYQEETDTKRVKEEKDDENEFWSTSDLQKSKQDLFSYSSNESLITSNHQLRKEKAMDNDIRHKARRNQKDGHKAKGKTKTKQKQKGNPKQIPRNIDSNCECGLGGLGSRGRIVNGNEADKHEYPFIVSVQYKRRNRHFCGGSIISDHYILTAAHCTQGEVAEDLQIRPGDHDLTTNDVSREVYLPVKEILEHPQYDPNTMNCDIALLHLKKNLKFTWRVKPVCLTPPDMTYYRQSTTVIGWGKMEEDADDGSPVLRHVDVRVYSMFSCRNKFNLEPWEITSYMMCAWNTKQDSCQGDSGGPLIWTDPESGRYYQVGVVSWGVGCAKKHFPGVYVKLTKFLEWIYEHTSDSVFCSAPTPSLETVFLKNKRKMSKKKKKEMGVDLKDKRKGNDKEDAINNDVE